MLTRGKLLGPADGAAFASEALSLSPLPSNHAATQSTARPIIQSGYAQMDFDTALQHFVNYMHYERNFSAHSIRNYGEDIELFIRFITPPGETTPSVEATELILLREFVSSLYARSLSKPTIKRKIAALRAFFKFCVREHWVEGNPAKMLHSPKLPIRVPRVQTPEELSSFLDRMPGGKSRQAAPIIHGRRAVRGLYARDRHIPARDRAVVPRIFLLVAW